MGKSGGSIRKSCVKFTNLFVFYFFSKRIRGKDKWDRFQTLMPFLYSNSLSYIEIGMINGSQPLNCVNFDLCWLFLTGITSSFFSNSHMDLLLSLAGKNGVKLW